jgi:glutamine cyclotransferase
MLRTTDRQTRRCCALLLLLLGAGGCAAQPPAAPVYGYTIVRTYPHDPAAFTQGLVVHRGALYEGTGLHGRSTLRVVDLETGTVLRRYDLPPHYFGEGIALYGDRLVQLTWQSRLGLVYEQDDFALVREFQYPTEGWGITYDGARLIMSDGTATLHMLNPETFEPVGRVEVADRGRAVTGLNELEFVGGEVYANVWQTDRIARIEPHTGRVVAWIDLSGLLSPAERAGADALNGIAYDAASDRLFVTGKLWPRLFEIQLAGPRGSTP